VSRLAELAGPDGWPQRLLSPPRFTDGARIDDLTLGTAGVLLAALWAGRHGDEAAWGVAEHAAAVLVDHAEELPSGLNWLMVPRRFHAEAPVVQMPNLSHGLAGVATALAVAGPQLGRPELTEAARRGAEHLVTLGDRSGGGFVVPRRIPPSADLEEVTYTWCHGPAGTALLFSALHWAGVAEVAGEAPLAWQRRCLHSVRTSGVPDRLRPGFWDNDGRCCGTAGVGDVFLDAWQQSGDEDHLDFAAHLADVLVVRAVNEGDRAYWRFVEHRADEPLLPPGVGWMQGAAGIVGFLFRVSRALAEGGGARSVARMDDWWTLP
jgi:lantibiotic modifying enzyme